MYIVFTQKSLNTEKHHSHRYAINALNVPGRSSVPNFTQKLIDQSPSPKCKITGVDPNVYII